MFTITLAATYDEKFVIRKCVAGNRKYQKILYDKYAPSMYVICMRYAHDNASADDILQEGFVKVFLHLSNFKFKGSFEGWMKRIFVNTAIEFYRKRVKLKEQLPINQALEQANDFDILDYISYKELLEVIQSLPLKYKTTFNLYVLEGYTHQEISELLNISEGTSKSQLFRARSLLQQQLKEKNIVYYR